ncbi:amidase family protein [Psychromonas sp. KJ10-10]|uniref:amidase family protein n=1 Tax=Psychromonas sp. KJ10-10 TaxID=3391823 RepID=UPI0039B3E2FD
MDKDTQVYCAQGPSHIAPMSAGTLSGLRFVFKDLFNFEGYKTGAGNPKWLETHDVATATSPLIIKLLKQGASRAGRVQTDELAYSLNGQNIHYGTPVNPVAPDCIPGGSSSGSAVAVARGDVDFAIGTDTGGSIRVPASYCGLYGLRPTLGLFDLSECFELSASFDTAGIFSQNLQRLEQVYQALLPNPTSAGKVDQLYLDNLFLGYFSQARLSQLEKYCQDAGIELLIGDFLEVGQWKLDELSELFRTIQGFEIIQKHSDWLNEYGDSLDAPILDRVNWSRKITRRAIY